MYQDFPNNIGFVGQYDSDVADAMNLELKRQRRNIGADRQSKTSFPQPCWQLWERY